ncbi:hypothetical protein PR048_017801 [Dryococelus australis]|uniref:Uncharacterized protein n=1 Tax=Dryococelus australis TaxID=614101 RepID=A0ABQ9HAQ2_9NEOP|nr:hypothetical protein PR048_017801 [Dryococelus australis]
MKTFFRNIIAREYNLSFGTPVTDACSMCISLQEAVKRETDINNKKELLIELRFSFDCQKNLVSPKVPGQIAYHSRQLYTYNCNIVQGSSKSKLTAAIIIMFT